MKMTYSEYMTHLKVCEYTGNPPVGKYKEMYDLLNELWGNLTMTNIEGYENYVNFHIGDTFLFAICTIDPYYHKIYISEHLKHIPGSLLTEHIYHYLGIPPTKHLCMHTPGWRVKDRLRELHRKNTRKSLFKRIVDGIKNFF